MHSLGIHNTICYLEEDFETEIMRMTGGRGVDVVINTLAGDAMQKGMNCLAPGGRYIEIAMTALKSAKSVDLSVLHNNQSFHSVDLRKLSFKIRIKSRTINWNCSGWRKRESFSLSSQKSFLLKT
nr:zinc-binding dehydrogenase [Bacillus velezensis]